VDQSEFARRIKVDVERDLRGLDVDRIAASLAPALHPYVRAKEELATAWRAYVDGSASRNALLVFTATSDGTSLRYRPTALYSATRVR